MEDCRAGDLERKGSSPSSLDGPLEPRGLNGRVGDLNEIAASDDDGKLQLEPTWSTWKQE